MTRALVLGAALLGLSVGFAAGTATGEPGVSACVRQAWASHVAGDDRMAMGWLGRADEARFDGRCDEP